MKKNVLFSVLAVLLTSCIFLPDMPQRKPGEEQRYLIEGQKAFDDKAYPEAIRLFQTYLDKYPQARDYSIVLQRLGESFEGLLEMEYQRRIKNGESETLVRKQFLEKYGSYKCWDITPAGITYNRMQYKILLKKYPDSPIADEAAYRMITWEPSYHGRPEGVLRELKQLQGIFEKYPTTSFRPMILYQMAHRCSILYEMYSFSPSADVRNPQRAQEYREKAIFLYQLSLKSPEHTKYSDKSWKEMEELQKGERIYHFD